MKLGIQLGISQKQTLALTPALLQSIHILGLSRMELDEYIEAELSLNPVLEVDDSGDSVEISPEIPDVPDDRVLPDRRAEDFDWNEYITEKEYDSTGISNIQNQTQWYEPEDTETNQSLRANLIDQLTEENLTRISQVPGRAVSTALCVIESLDDNGILLASPGEIAKLSGVSEEEASAAIAVIRELEPAGVGAKDVRDALLIQYERNGGADPIIKQIIMDCLEDVAQGRISKIAQKTGLTNEVVTSAIEIIKTLNPKPGRGFAGSEQVSYIVPDVVIEKAGDEAEVVINNYGMPHLLVSPYYLDVLKSEKSDSDAAVFLRNRLNSATTLIKSLEQRGKTVYNVTVVIFRYQSEFLEVGERGLKPLTLKMIADELGIHESTVSRSVRGKYVQTPKGVFELKRFLCSGIRTNDGNTIAADSLKATIIDFIGDEDKKAPLSDERIAEKLKMSGAFISRRTVAKYREEMGIPSSPVRRRRD